MKRNQYPPARKKSPPTFKITNLQSQKKEEPCVLTNFLLMRYLQPFPNSGTTKFFSIFLCLLKEFQKSFKKVQIYFFCKKCEFFIINRFFFRNKYKVHEIQQQI